MKKTKITALILTAVLSTSYVTSALAAGIPMESVPRGATEESVIITENLISGILDDVQNGLDYGAHGAK